MTDISARYRKLAADFADTVSQVPADKWSAQSPCEEWTARDVLRHVVETPSIFTGMVGRTLEPGPSVDADPAGAFAAVSEQIQADLDDPERANTSYDGMFGRTTFADSIDRFISGDLLVHRWDLAKAAGIDVELDAEECRHELEVARNLGDSIRSHGVCGPEVEVPADASDQDKMLAYMGRQP